MPEAWSDKDERMFEHVKASAKERGRSQQSAEEVAARTVNKHRREEGRTANRITQGTGNPYRPLDKRTVPELRNRARELAIDGRSQMNKKALVTAIREHS